MSYTYDSKDVVLAVAGIPMGSFGENKITISRNNDVTVLMEGVDGENMFATSNRKAGTISFDLIYGSDHDLLMDNLSGYSKLFPVIFAHAKGRKGLVTSGKIASQPDVNLGETPEFRSWVLVVDSVEMSIKDNVSNFMTNITNYVAS